MSITLHIHVIITHALIINSITRLYYEFQLHSILRKQNHTILNSTINYELKMQPRSKKEIA
jgi:hypothetical protein